MMNRHPRVPRFGAVALSLPVFAGVGTWVWVAATTSVAACQAGSALGVGTAGWVVLLGAPPLVIVADGLARRERWTRIASTVLAAILLTVLAVWIAAQVWWLGHGCYD